MSVNIIYINESINIDHQEKCEYRLSSILSIFIAIIDFLVSF